MILWTSWLRIWVRCSGVVNFKRIFSCTKRGQKQFLVSNSLLSIFLISFVLVSLARPYLWLELSFEFAFLLAGSTFVCSLQPIDTDSYNMGIKDAHIELDNAWATYYPGQTIKGKVHFTFDSPKKVRGIFVQFIGEAHTSWSEKQSQRDAQGHNHDVMLPYSGKEEYFHVTYYVLGSKNGNEIEIPPGTHSYELSATLPPSLPSSFEGEFGYVRYTITVTLDRPWKFDQETKMAFTVINPLDLNLNPSYKEPIHMQIEKTFCCLCCASAPLSVDVRAPVSGYVPGQSVPLSVAVDNQSGVQLHLVKIQLRKLVTFRTTTPSSAVKKSKVVLCEASEGPVPSAQTKEFLVKLEVPALPPSNLVGCGLIDLDYDLKVECLVSGAHMNPSDKKYVTIGTVPLVVSSEVTQQPTEPVLPTAPVMPDPSVPSMGGAGETPDAPPPYQTLYPSLGSPVYQESQFNALNIQNNEHTRITGRHDFAPRYPTYRLPPPQ